MGSTVEYRFERDDLLRTRFAIAPLIELVGAAYVVRQPRLYPEHRRWVETATPRLRALDLSLVYAAAPLGRTSWPNFNAPPPVSPHPRIDDELARVGATDPELVRADIHRAHPDGVPTSPEPFIDGPGRCAG